MNMNCEDMKLLARRGGRRGELGGLDERSLSGLGSRERRSRDELVACCCGTAARPVACDCEGRGGGGEGGTETGDGGATRGEGGECAVGGAGRGEGGCASARTRLRVSAPRSSPAIRSAAAARHASASAAASVAVSSSSIEVSRCSPCCCGCRGCSRCSGCRWCWRCRCARRRRVRSFGCAPAGRPAGRAIDEGCDAGQLIRKKARTRPSTNST